MCSPAQTITNGLKMKDRGVLKFERAEAQYGVYQREVRNLGYTIISMPANDDFPDSVFPEDPGVILQLGKKNLLVVTRLKDPSRQGEEAILEKALAPYFKDVEHITPPGFVEGGDVLVTDHGLYIGLSGRTNAHGAEQLAKIAKDQFGMNTKIFTIPPNWLHLKGGASYHRAWSGQKPVIVVSAPIEHHFVDTPGCEVMITSEAEHYAYYSPNCLSKGKNILVHQHSHGVIRQMERVGFNVIETDLSEFWKIDGAMTCLSKIFQSTVVVH